MESNKLIAEFMELETDDNGMYRYTTSVDDYATDDLSYFEYSWDWLMPVVDKIEALKGDESWTISTELNSVIVWMHSPYVDSIRLIEVSGDNKREATYKAVVLFIKEYNRNK